MSKKKFKPLFWTPHKGDFSEKMVGKNAKILGFGALAPFHFWPKFKLGFFVPRLRRGRVNPAPAPRGTNAASKPFGFFGRRSFRFYWHRQVPMVLLDRRAMVTH